MKITTKGSEPKRETGQVLILFVLALAVLLGFMAMATDVGLALHERRQLQNAADAAALAGVAYLPEDPGAAEDAALAWATNNGIAPGEVVAVEFEDGNTLIRMRVRRDISTMFARVLGILSFEANAKAAAQTGSMSGVTGLAPFGVLESAVQYCDTPPPVNCLVTLKYDVNDTGATIGDLDFDGSGGGANEVADKIKGGNKNPLCSTNEPSPPPGCPTEEGQKPGNSTGQIRDAINWRIDQTTGECDTIDEVLGPDTNGDGRPEIVSKCNPWSKVAEDTDGDGGSCDNLPGGIGSCRIIAIPVIEGDELPPPNEDVTNVKFALFWLEPFEAGKCQGNTCEVRGYFLDAEVSVSGLIGDLNLENNPFVVFKLVE